MYALKSINLMYNVLINILSTENYTRVIDRSNDDGLCILFANKKILFRLRKISVLTRIDDGHDR